MYPLDMMQDLNLVLPSGSLFFLKTHLEPMMVFPFLWASSQFTTTHES